jgi:hypothetical protein
LVGLNEHPDLPLKSLHYGANMHSHFCATLTDSVLHAELQRECAPTVFVRDRGGYP